MPVVITPRQRMQSRWASLKQERASWMTHWQEISEVLLPRSGRFFVSDRNRGEKRHRAIYDNTGTRALRILAAGMMSGMTSPARPWFRLGIADTDLAKREDVRVWLAECTRIMLAIFAKSNTYRALHSAYTELGAFGTAASITEEHFTNFIHHHPMTTGEFAIATDDYGTPNTIYREFQQPVNQVVAKFGIDNVSATVRTMYDNGNLDAWIPLIHGIEPRSDRDPTKLDAKNMAWKSCYFEVGANSNTYLRESGYKSFPALVSRWEVMGGDIYGNSPGMEALGDVRQLQHEQLRKANAIDYQTKPPLQIPTAMRGQEVDTLPGGTTFYDPSGGGAGGIKTLFDVNLNLEHLLGDIQDVRGRINASFYADLFLMLSQDNGTMTATEVAERHEEKLLALGPVLERLHNEQLDPLVDSTFTRAIAAGMMPQPPEALHGMDLQVEFISILAQAQRAVSTTGVDRFVMGLGTIAPLVPSVLDRFDADYWAKTYSDNLGVDPEMIVGDDKVALIRQQRAQQQAQQQAAAMANANADTASKLGGVPTGAAPQDNAANDIMSMFSGYNSPSAESY